MSLAIKFGDDTNTNSLSGVIYIDATTDFNRTYSGDVTKHPIEAGASVTDHFISSNPKITISGVISHVDFSQYPKQIKIDDLFAINANDYPTPVIVSDMGSSLAKFIPGSISQFIPPIPQDVKVDQRSRVNYRDFIEILMREIITGLYYNEDKKRWENKMTPATIYVIERLTPLPFMKDLILTSFSVKENADSGEELFFDASFEQVKFVTLQKANAPKAAKKTADARATQKQENKGTASTSSTNNPEDVEELSTTGQITKARSLP
jgi:hypothetical protein